MLICLEYYSLVISLEFRLWKIMFSTVKNRYTTNTVADQISSPRIGRFFVYTGFQKRKLALILHFVMLIFLERNHNKPFVDTEITKVISRSVLPPRWYLSTGPIFPLW